MKTLGLCYFLWKKQGTLLIFGRGVLKAIWKAIQLRANSIFFLGRKWRERMVKWHRNLLMQKKVIFFFYAIIKFPILLRCSFRYCKTPFWGLCKYLTILVQFLFAEKLYDFLNIQLESDLNLKRSKSPFHSSFFQLF